MYNCTYQQTTAFIYMGISPYQGYPAISLIKHLIKQYNHAMMQLTFNRPVLFMQWYCYYIWESYNNKYPVSNDENCLMLTCQLLEDNVHQIVSLIKDNGIYIKSPTDISIVNRLGEEKISQGPDRRDINLKFCRQKTKQDLFPASRPKKGSKFLCEWKLHPSNISDCFYST